MNTLILMCVNVHISNSKDSVHGHHHNIQLLNPTKSQARQSRGEPQLGPLLVFKDQLIVTYTADALLVLDPQSISVVAALYDVQRISALCVTKSEIFILEGERHLIRIGFAPQLTPTAGEKTYCVFILFAITSLSILQNLLISMYLHVNFYSFFAVSWK